MPDVTEKLLNRLSEFLDKAPKSSQTPKLTAGQAFLREIENDPRTKAAVESSSKRIVERVQKVLDGLEHKVGRPLAPDSDKFYDSIWPSISKTVPNLDDEEQTTGDESKATKKPNSKKRRGRRPDTDKKKDKQIWEAWQTGQYKTVQELADHLKLTRRR